MLLGLVTLASAVLIGQAPAAAPALKALPADAEVVVHVKGVSAVRDDLIAMIKAMSPTLGDQLEPVITQGVASMSERFGEKAATTPFLAMIKLPQADEAGQPPPFAVLVPAADYDAVLKEIAGPNGEVKAEKQAGGYDKFTSQDGESVYSYKGDGFVAFGQGSDLLVKAIAAKPAESLDTALSPELKAQLFGGDVGIYVNLQTVQTRYADQIEEARKSLADMMEQAAQMQGAQAGQTEQAKKLIETGLTNLKDAEALGLSVDFDAQAFDVSALVRMKAGSAGHTALTGAYRGTAADLAKLPANELAFMYMNIDPKSSESLMAMNFGNLGLGNRLGDAAEKASIEAVKALGRQESFAGVSFDKGMNIIAISRPEHPEKALAVAEQTQALMTDSPFVKESKVEAKVLSYNGFDFNRTTVTMDIDKLIEQQGQGNPAAEQMVKAMLGGDTMVTYSGTDGKTLLTVTAKTDDALKAKVDTLLGSSGSIGAASSYGQVRSRLPEQVSGMFLIHMQELTKQMASLIGGMMGAELPVPGDVPKEPAVLGGAITMTPAGFRLDFVVPTTVGPVVERGLVPMFQGLQGQVNQ